jgi:hypothetical protein
VCQENRGFNHEKHETYEINTGRIKVGFFPVFRVTSVLNLRGVRKFPETAPNGFQAEGLGHISPGQSAALALGNARHAVQSPESLKGGHSLFRPFRPFGAEPLIVPVPRAALVCFRPSA